MKGGASMESIANENSLEIVSHGALRRDDERVPASISQRAFSMSHPSEGGSVADGMAQADGSFVLIELYKVTPGPDKRDD